jgi:pantoate--beta-alanine ligase
MEIITKVTDIQKITSSLHSVNKKIALVPTMGFFHEGHLCLMRRAKELTDIVITSLFVNPAQFGPNEDFEQYPRDFENDYKSAESNGTNYLFFPSTEQMYPKGDLTKIQIVGFTKKFEGVTRPQHFDGVATIVSKLFNCIIPDYALFGQKDYQQVLLIKQLVRDMLYNINIIVVPTVREDDGLALSSRNVYLSPEERLQAGIIFKALEEARGAVFEGENRRKMINAYMHNILRSEPNIRIDYASSADADTLDEPETFLPGEHIVLLIAAYLGKTRLIDNSIVSIPMEPGVKKHYFVEGI